MEVLFVGSALSAGSGYVVEVFAGESSCSGASGSDACGCRYPTFPIPELRVKALDCFGLSDSGVVHHHPLGRGSSS
jgi:hypothetical protein